MSKKKKNMHWPNAMYCVTQTEGVIMVQGRDNI